MLPWVQLGGGEMTTAPWYEPRSTAEDLIFREIAHESADTQDATLRLFCGSQPAACERIRHKLLLARDGRAIYLEAIG